MYDKGNRRNVLAGIIGSSRIRTQEELIQALEAKGISATQATLSRDMKEMGVVKVPDARNGSYYSLPARQNQRSRVNVESVELSGQICVLHCLPGFASAAASVVDEAGIDGVMGSVAGDDTVMLAIRADADSDAVLLEIRQLFNIVDIEVRVAEKKDERYAEAICEEIYISSQERKTGIAKRTPEYIKEKIRAGKAVIALAENGDFAGFSYIESWGGKSFVANSGLIVAHRFRGLGVARRIKEQTFLLSRKLFPDAKIFSITTGAAVMKMNYEFGFRPVPYSELTDDPEFWKGCEGCRHFDILKSHDYKMCICTGLLYNPEEHLTIHHPGE